MSIDYADPSTTTPVDWTGPIFSEPLLYSGAAVWFLLLIAALIGLMFYRQRLFDDRLARQRAPEAIFHAIRRVLDQALIKTGDETIGAGRRVQDALDQHLGPLLSFSGALGGPAGKLNKALSGKAEPHQAQGHHDHPEPKKESQPAVVVTSNAEQKVVIAPARIVTSEAADVGHEATHAVEMSARDQRVAVREALEHLSEFWRKEPVERHLSGVQDALMAKGSTPRPAQVRKVKSAESRLLLGPLAPRKPASPAKPL